MCDFSFDDLGCGGGPSGDFCGGGSDLPAATPGQFSAPAFVPPASDPGTAFTAPSAPSTPFSDSSIFDASTFAPSSDTGPIQTPTSFDNSSTFSPSSANIGSGFVPGFGATDLTSFDTGGSPLDSGSNAAGTGLPAFDFGSIPPQGFDSFAQDTTIPPNATPTSGTVPSNYTTPTFSQEQFSGPVGSSSVPNAAALNASPAATGVSAGPDLGAPAGQSAAGGTASGTDLTSDLTKQKALDNTVYGSNPFTPYGATNPAYDVPGQAPPSTSPASSSGGGSGGSGGGSSDKGFLSSLTNNPAGLALGAAGLGFNILNGQKLTKALQGGTGQSPEANLAAAAAPAIAQGQALTTQGAGIVGQGANNVNANAADLAATGHDLVGTGTATSQNAVHDLGQLVGVPAQTANTLQTQGTNLTGFLGTGKLPAGIQAQLDQAKADARTQIISKYASHGMPTDPTKNSSLQAELQDLDRRTVAQGEQLAATLATTGNTLAGTGLNASQVAGSLVNNQGNIGTTTTGQGLTAANAAGTQFGQAGNLGSNLVNSGISETGLGTNTFKTLSDIDQKQAEATQKAIAAMAAALSGQNITNATKPATT